MRQSLRHNNLKENFTNKYRVYNNSSFSGDFFFFILIKCAHNSCLKSFLCVIQYALLKKWLKLNLPEQELHVHWFEWKEKPHKYVFTQNYCFEFTKNVLSIFFGSSFHLLDTKSIHFKTVFNFKDCLQREKKSVRFLMPYTILSVKLVLCNFFFFL